jgi:D-alanyl-D-alanine carboxypeptidase
LLLVSSLPARRRRDAGLLLLSSALAALVLVSCRTVAAPGNAADAAVAAEPAASGAVTTVAPVSTLAPTAVPTPAPTRIPRTTAAPTPWPTVAPTPEPTVAPTPDPNPETAAVGAATDTARLGQRKRDRLDTILANHARNKGFVGLQAAVRLPSGETWVGTAGSAEFGPARAVAKDTQFAVASVTKTFIAALILQLADEGKLELDVPYGRYFDGPVRPKTVTIRQLLSHTSGIYDYFSHPRYQNAAAAWLRSAPTGMNSREHRWTYEEIMGLVKSGYCKPGQCYRYSNTNYVLLGRIAEAVGGAPVAEQLRQRFFKPLGLGDTVFQPAQRPRTDAAHGHWGPPGAQADHTRGARVLPFMAAVSVADAAGAIASTSSDLATWAQALYGGELLSDESLRQMTTILREGTYGLGTDVALFAGHRAYGHRGGLRGFESSMWYFPETGVSVALLSNRGNFGTDPLLQKLVRTAIGKG